MRESDKILAYAAASRENAWRQKHEEDRKWAAEQAVALLSVVGWERSEAPHVVRRITDIADALLAWLADPGAAHEPAQAVAERNPPAADGEETEL